MSRGTVSSSSRGNLFSGSSTRSTVGSSRSNSSMGSGVSRGSSGSRGGSFSSTRSSGASGHSAGSLGAVVGVALGACVIEKHVMLDGVESADSKFSMTMQEFAQMVKDVRATQLIAKGPIYELSDNERSQKVYRRSLFIAKDIKAGEVFTAENVRDIRPAYGVSPRYLKDMMGKTSDRDLKKGDPVTEQLLKSIKVI